AVGAAAPTHAATGGAFSSDPGTVDSLSCRSVCDDDATVHEGGMIRVTGRSLGSAKDVIFLGKAGNADDVIVPAVRPRKRSVDARVPAGTPGGRVRVRTADGAQSAPSTDVIDVLPPEAPPEARRVQADSTSAAEPAAPLDDGA